MDLSKWAVPAGLAVAGIGAVVATGMVIGQRRRRSEQGATAEERTQLALQRRHSLQRRLAVIALAVGCLMMFVLAGIAAWLSFGAQREYAHTHNGGNWDAATAFAMLLDAGALSLSLIRFFEALTLRSSALTRILLFGFVATSAQMNLLHAPESGPGGAFLAVVPPLVYAVLLEMLLFKIEQVIMGRQKRRKADRERAYSLLLWLPWPIGSPVRMWRAWRAELLATIDNVRVVGSLRALPEAATPLAAVAGVAREKADPAQRPAAVGSVPKQAVGTDEKGAAASSAHPGSRPPATDATRPKAARVPARVPAPTPVPVPVPAEPVARPAGSGRPAGGKGERAVVPPVADQPPGGSEAATEGEAVPVDVEEPEVLAGEAQQGTGGDGAAARDEAVVEPSADSASPDSQARSNDGDTSADGSVEHGEPDTRYDQLAPGTGGHEVHEQSRRHIDLSSLPKNEGPRQLAERIYVAHHIAGLPLNKADLATWAGYKNPNSGSNEYRRLEKRYGPILEKEGAAYLDLDWSSLDQYTERITAQSAA
ncbi:DUF2637 domain-containing protein [Streptomyces sp. NPDC096339]|uniref:DUF2637 domain-containing protein n=1 Tax=Streptomyces sp. NPDC096339 TaxID=3366086 RepID=UPI0037F8F712